MSAELSFFVVTLKSKFDFGEPLSTGNFGAAVSVAARASARLIEIGSSDFAPSPWAVRVIL